MLVSAFLAAAALTQSVGNATGYARTGLLFVPTSARSSSYRHSRCRLRQHPPCRRRRFRPPLHRLPLLRLRRRRPPFRRFKCLRFRNCRCLHRPRLRRRLLPHRNYRRRDPAHACLGQGYRVFASRAGSRRPASSGAAPPGHPGSVGKRPRRSGRRFCRRWLRRVGRRLVRRSCGCRRVRCTYALDDPYGLPYCGVPASHRRNGIGVGRRTGGPDHSSDHRGKHQTGQQNEHDVPRRSSIC